jgi:hypothetical protein
MEARLIHGLQAAPGLKARVRSSETAIVDHLTEQGLGMGHRAPFLPLNTARCWAMVC